MVRQQATSTGLEPLGGETEGGYLEQLHMTVWFGAKALAGEAVLVGQRMLDVARLLWRRRQAGALFACLCQEVRQLALQCLHGRPVVPCVQQQLGCVVRIPAKTSTCTLSALTWTVLSAAPETTADKLCHRCLWQTTTSQIRACPCIQLRFVQGTSA